MSAGSDRPGPASGNAPRADKRARSGAARIYAVQALFQMEAANQSSDRVLAEFLNWRIAADYAEGTTPEADEALLAAILGDVVNWQARIDPMTDRALVAKWPIARIDPVLRAVFRAAGAELVATRTPPKVVISEYVGVADAFFPEGKEARFVNAVLDHMAREARPEAF